MHEDDDHAQLLHSFSFQCENTVTSPGDEIDNDCDSQIDEEIRDGRDNDGDGRIDEDLALVKIIPHQFLKDSQQCQSN